MTDTFFVYKRNGQPAGFMASKESEYSHKLNKFTCLIYRNRESLANHLREMVKSKQVKIVKTASVEAVVLTEAQALELVYKT